MNIFEQVEGMSGETMVSAVLRYLLLRSQDMRQQFIDLLSDASPAGPMDSASRFSCVLESATTDNQLGNGRLDLVLEGDDWILGIENKLQAIFQEGQPHKYQVTLHNRAVDLRGSRGTIVRSTVAVIAPLARIGEVEVQIGDNKESIFSISWEVVLARLSNCVGSCDEQTRVVFGFFQDYVNAQIGFLPKFKKKLPHLTKTIVRGGTEEQRQLLQRLWGLFPASGGRLSSGGGENSTMWVGYYFMRDESKYGTDCGWFGFVNASRFGGDQVGAKFVVAVSRGDINLPEPFESVNPEDLGDHFLGAAQTVSAWTLKFDESMDSRNRWEKLLGPILSLESST